MQQKYKLPLKKVGGSIYCLIPSGLVDQLDVKGDNEILADFEKYGDIVKELCNDFNESKKEVLIITNDDKEFQGIVAFTDKLSVTLILDNNNFVIPYNFIKEIKESDFKLNETKLGENG